MLLLKFFSKNIYILSPILHTSYIDLVITMEFRKIQFTGRSSYIISLPKKWIKENELKQGDVVPLLINPHGSITVLPKKAKRG